MMMMMDEDDGVNDDDCIVMVNIMKIMVRLRMAQQQLLSPEYLHGSVTVLGILCTLLLIITAILQGED